MNTVIARPGKNGMELAVLFPVIAGSMIAASVFHAHTLFLLLLAFISLFLAFTGSKHFIFLYIFFIPTNDIFLTEDFIFSFVGIKQIMGVCMLVYYVVRKPHIDRAFQASCSKNTRDMIGLLSKMIYLMLAYWVYRNFKDAYFGLLEMDYTKALLKSVNSFLFLFGLIPFVKILFSIKNEAFILNSLFFAIINMLFFSFLSPYLPILGLKSIGTEITEFDVSNYQRYAGIVPDGDSNTLGVFFVMTAMFFLLFSKKFKNWQLLTVLLGSFFIIALSGSRTAFITLLIGMLLYLVYNKNKTLKLRLVLLLPVLVIIAMPFLNMLLDRLSLSNEQLDTNTESNRIGKWFLYIDFFLQNPVTFLSGAQTELLIGWGNVFYAAHNVYITMVYFSGLVFPGIFLFLQYKILRKCYRLKILPEFLMIYIPFFFLTMFVSDLGILYGFILYMAFFIRLKSLSSGAVPPTKIPALSNPVYENTVLH